MSAPLSLTTLAVVQGAALARTIQGANLDGTVPAEFLGTDTLSGSIWVGQAEPALVSFTPTWVDAPTCQVQVALTGTQTAALSVDATYNLQVFATRSGTTYCIGWTWLKVLPAAGSQASPTPPDLVSYPVLAQLLGSITLTQAQAEMVPTLVTAASAAIRSFCNRTFTQGVYTEILPVEEDGTIRMAEIPVNFVSRVQSNPTLALSVSNATADSAWVSVDATGDVFAGLTVAGLLLNSEAGGVVTQAPVAFTANMTIAALATAISAVPGWSATATPGAISGLPVAELYDLYAPSGAGPGDEPSGAAGFHAFASNLTNARPHPDDGQKTGVWVVGRQRDGTGPRWGPGWSEFDDTPAGFGRVKVTYNGGFASIPPEIQLATAELVKSQLDRLKTDLTLRSETAADYSYATRDDIMALPRHVLTALCRYRSVNA